MLAVAGVVFAPCIDVIERGLLQGLGVAVEHCILAEVLGRGRGDRWTRRLGRIIAP
jgi:hypothetical protein